MAGAIKSLLRPPDMREAAKWVAENPQKAMAMARASAGVVQELNQKARSSRAARAAAGPGTKSRFQNKLGPVGSKGGSQVRPVAAPPTNFGYAANSNSFSLSTRTKESEVVTGSTILGTVQTYGNNNAQIVGLYNIVPTLLADRVATIAGTYDKYVYKRVTATYTPICSTSTSGSILMYFDRDIMDPPANPANLQTFMSAQNATLGPVYAKTQTTMLRDKDEKRTYFTSPGSSIDPHEISQFKLVVAATGVASGAAPLGIVTLTYELELIAPVYIPREVAPALSAINQYAFAIGNASFLANSNSTSGAPFGLSSLTQAPVFEIIVCDTNSTAVNGGFTWGVGGATVSVPASGTTWYLTTTSVNAALGTTAFSIYSTYQGALARGPGHIHNNNGAGTNLFVTANVRYTFRAVGSQNGLAA